MTRDKEDTVIMPLWDYVILHLPEDQKSLIVKPDSSKSVIQGTLDLVVLFTGPSCVNIKPGDRLICNPAAMIPFAYQGQQYWLISERATGGIVSGLRVIQEAPDRRLPQ